MRVMSLRKAFISQIRLPGDIRLKAEKDPHVAELAKSIEKTGVIHPPIIRWAGRKVKVPITGKDVLAALIKLGRPEFLCLSIECTHQEAYEMAMHSNLYRKVMTPEEAAQAASPLLTWPPFAAGELPKEAREEISKSLRLVGAGPRPARTRDGIEQDPELVFQDLGCELTPEFLDSVRVVFVEMSRAAFQIGTALGTLLRLQSRKLPVVAPVLDRIIRDLTSIRDSVIAGFPYGLCPWCKGFSDEEFKCTWCSNVRWMPEEQFKAAPPKLLDTDDKVIVLDGQPRRLAEVLE